MAKPAPGTYDYLPVRSIRVPDDPFGVQLILSHGEVLMSRTFCTVWLAMVVVLVSAACAAGGATGSGRSQSVITQTELESVRATSLYDAVQRLRPRWLSVRSNQTLGGGGATAIVVYQNQSRLGGIEILQQLDTEAALWLEYLDGPTASASLPGIGSQDVEGAIIVHTTPRRQ